MTYLFSIVCLVLYMSSGALLFEWSWSKMKAYREINEDRDSNYPAFRRWDAVNWKKWKFYPGAIIMLPVRLFIIMVLMGLIYLFVRVTTLGHSFKNDQPIRGWFRNLIIGGTYKIYSSLVMIIFGVWTTKRDVDFDYSPYLGPQYKETTIYPKYMSTYVCNHSSWTDIMLLISYFRPAFAAKLPIKKVPALGLITQTLGCIFVARGGTLEERNQIVE